MNKYDEEWILDLAAGLQANIIRREDGDILDILLDGVTRAYTRGYDCSFVDDLDASFVDELHSKEEIK